MPCWLLHRHLFFVFFVWHPFNMVWDADNPTLGTTGVQALLDVLPAAVMKKLQLERTCVTMGVVCLSWRVAKLSAAALHGRGPVAVALTQQSGWCLMRACTVSSCAWCRTECGNQGRLSFGTSTWRALEDCSLIGTFQRSHAI